MKIALIQINPIIGDFSGNAALIERQANRAKEMGAQLALFPELALCGYPPLDYLEHPSFLEEQNKYLLCILCSMRYRLFPQRETDQEQLRELQKGIAA